MYGTHRQCTFPDTNVPSLSPPKPPILLSSVTAIFLLSLVLSYSFFYPLDMVVFKTPPPLFYLLGIVVCNIATEGV